MAKKSNDNALWGLLFVVGLYLSAAFLFKLHPFRSSIAEKDNFVQYPGFGIELPKDYAIHGIDVSRYQNRINWSLVARMKSLDVQLQFAVMKATEGQTFVDRTFKRNWKNSREAGMIRGAYHFFRGDKDAAAQARNFISTVRLLPGDLPPVLDVESLYNTPVPEFQDKVAIWLGLVEQHYKVKPILYSNASFYNNYLHPRFEDYPLWVAHYKERHQPRVNRNWLMWQHNEGGRVDGIQAFVDFNVFNGDSLSFRKMLIGGR